VALEMIGPMPGTLISHGAVVGLRELLDLGGYSRDALIEPTPVGGEVLHQMHHARRQPVGQGERARQLGAQCPPALADGDAALEQEGADLVDDAGALRHQPLAHAVQRLQVELRGRLQRHVSDGWPCHRLGDRLRVVEVVLLLAAERAHILGGHQAHVVAKSRNAPAQVMGTDAGLHADQAGRRVGQANLDLGPRQALAQHDGATFVEADEMEGVLADVDAQRGDGGGLGLGNALHGLGSLLLFPSAGRWGARPDHPISGPSGSDEALECVRIPV